MGPVVFNTDFAAHYGTVERVAPGIRRVLANNPSKFSAWGTGTYLVGGDEHAGGPGGPVAVIDPGPLLDSHLTALGAALEGEHVAAILITHTHGDHSPAAAPLAQRTGAIRYGFGPHPVDADRDSDPAEAHGDTDFVPDVTLRDLDTVGAAEHPGAAWTFEALYTPGHLSNHLCFAELERGVMFSGDHVMGWSTTVVSPPAGNMAQYLASLERMIGRGEHTYYPTHGAPITNPVPFVRSLIEHRLHRDRQILQLLAERGPQRIAELVEVMYADVRADLHEPARRSVHAHLIRLGALGETIQRGEEFAIARKPGHLSS